MSHLVVDSTLVEAVQEYSLLLDALQVSHSLNQLASPVVPELFPAVVDLALVLAKVSDREFEPAFNLVAHILLEAGEQYPVLLARLVDEALVSKALLTPVPAVQDRKALRPTTVVSALTTVFNLVPATLPLRITCLETVVVVAESAALPEILLPLAGTALPLPQWVAQAGGDATELARKVAALVVGVDAPAAVGLLLAVASSELLADYFVEFALQSPVVNLVPYAAAAAAAGAAAQTQFQNYISGTVSGFSGTTLAKARLVAVARLATTTALLPYADVAQALGVAADEVEAVLVQAIEDEVVDARLNQRSATLTVHRVLVPTSLSFSTEQWQEVAARLAATKARLQHVAETVEAAKKKKGGFVTAHKKQRPAKESEEVQELPEELHA